MTLVKKNLYNPKSYYNAILKQGEKILFKSGEPPQPKENTLLILTDFSLVEGEALLIALMVIKLVWNTFGKCTTIIKQEPSQYVKWTYLFFTKPNSIDVGELRKAVFKIKTHFAPYYTSFKKFLQAEMAEKWQPKWKHPETSSPL